MHVKRWIVLLIFGITFVSLGVAYVITNVYRTQPFPEEIYYVTLQFVDRPIRGALFALCGLALSAVAIYQLHRSLLSPFMSTDRGSGGLVDSIYQHRLLGKGPKIVAIGGGHGLSTLLRGLKKHTGNLTAIVTVADDGGSSGRLRREMGVLPPGDIRMCLVALADAEPLMKELFQYRFDKGTGLEGHSFGNLFLAAMNEITGNFESALRESSRVLAVRGQILPSTLEDIQLVAEYEDGQFAHGESAVPLAGKPISRVSLEPAHPAAHPDAIKAILEAEMIILGPGSLYTSLLPNLLVDDVARAIRGASAVKVYVCNVATQHGETDNFAAMDHITAIERHAGANLFQFVLINDNERTIGFIGEDSDPVRATSLPPKGDYQAVFSDVVDIAHPHFHDGDKLAQALLRLFHDRDASRGAPQSNDEPSLVTSR